MLKAVLFDMDGVIIDSEPLYFEIDRMVFKKYGFEVEDTFLHRYVGVSNPEMWQDVLKHYPFELDVEALMAEQKGFRDVVLAKAALPVIRGIRELLEDLRSNGVKTAVASSSSRKLIEHVLLELDLDMFFDAVVSGEEMERGKPFPDIFLKAAEILNVEPEECVVIEDSSHGLKAAKAAGMRSIGFANPNSGGQDLSLATCVVEDFRSVSYLFISGM